MRISFLLVALVALASGKLAYAQNNVQLAIQPSNGPTQNYSAAWSPGQTVEHVLQIALPKPQSGPAYIAEWYPSFGAYIVTRIGSDVNGQQASWQYCVNDISAPLGINRIVTAPGDRVTFKFIAWDKMSCP